MTTTHQAAHVAVLEAIRAGKTTYSGADEDAALTAAIAAMKQQGWQPIETVPRDGTRVVVWMPDGSFSSAAYSTHSEPQGTHWMTPAAPTEASR